MLDHELHSKICPYPEEAGACVKWTAWVSSCLYLALKVALFCTLPGMVPVVLGTVKGPNSLIF